jgi:hypothetical protein|tara:strand:- start:504 stop:689 length:186 start_codon:yes stop_codon:yes gene_type:complete
MDIVSMFAVLVAGLIDCSGIESIRENILTNQDLPTEVKQEIIDVIHKSNPECELNERSESS